MMRRATVVLSLIGLLWQTAACSSTPAEEPTGPPSAASPSAPSGSPPPVSPSVPPTAGGPPSARPKPPGATPPGPPGPPAPTASGDVQGPLPWGPRTLTGVVERSGGCTMLVVGERRWALTGVAAGALHPGAKVTVRGNLTTRPAACGDRDLAQTLAVTRVLPA